MTTRDAKAQDTEGTIDRTPAMRRRWQRAALLVALVALGTGADACGGESTPGIAGFGSSTTTTPGSSSSSGLSEARALKYAECMRSHGLANFPDPSVMSNGQIGFNIQANGNSDLDPRSPQYLAAQKVCEKYLPSRKVTPSDKAAESAAGLKYAECMRSHGEPGFPDPNGQGVIQITNPTGILDPNSSQYERAQTACQSLFTNDVTIQTQSGSGSGGPHAVGAPGAGSGSS